MMRGVDLTEEDLKKGEGRACRGEGIPRARLSYAECFIVGGFARRGRKKGKSDEEGTSNHTKVVEKCRERANIAPMLGEKTGRNGRDISPGGSVFSKSVQRTLYDKSLDGRKRGGRACSRREGNKSFPSKNGPVHRKKMKWVEHGKAW